MSFQVLIFVLTWRLFIFYLTKKIQLKLLLFWHAGCAQTTLMFYVMTGDQTQDTGRVELSDINFWLAEENKVKCDKVQLEKL